MPNPCYKWFVIFVRREQNMNVLVIADEYYVLSELTEFLLHFRQEMCIRVANSARQAYECVENEKFDMIVNALLDEKESQKWKALASGYAKILLFVPKVQKERIEEQKHRIIEQKRIVCR